MPAHADSANPDSAARLDRVQHRFGRLTVLDEVSFALQTGHVCAFLGRNGAGKTTTLKLMAGLMAPDSGELTVLGKRPWQSPEIRQHIGYLPERPPLYPRMTVGEHLRLAATLHGLRGSKLEPALERVVERCDLGSVLSRSAGRLSLGYRQRLALAMAVIHEPQVLLLDEPGNGLDPVQLARLRELIQTFAEYSAVLYSTHLLDEALATGDRILVIRDGHIVFDGTDRDLEHDRQDLLLRFETSVDTAQLNALEGVADCRPEPDGSCRIRLNADCSRSQLLRRLSELPAGLQAVIPVGAREHLLACMTGEGLE